MDWLKQHIEREQARLDSLRAKLESDDVEETEHENAIICPYCGKEDGDDRYDGEGEHEYTCGHCEQDYLCEVHVRITYSTSRIKPRPQPDGTMKQVWPEVENA